MSILNLFGQTRTVQILGWARDYDLTMYRLGQIWANVECVDFPITDLQLRGGSPGTFSAIYLRLPSGRTRELPMEFSISYDETSLLAFRAGDLTIDSELMETNETG